MFDDWRMRLGRWRQRGVNRRAERVERYTDLRLGLAPTWKCHREARAVYIGDETLLCRVQGRYYLFVSSRDINITPALANFGRVDPWISRVIARLVQPGMIVADVGANVGYFTMQLAQRVGPRGRVHAFEPNIELARLIRRSADANHFGEEVVIHPVPLGAETGREMWLCVPGDALAGSAVHDEEWRQGWMAREDDLGHDDRYRGNDARAVTLQRLDSLPHAREIAFAKIDVEGFEPSVWAGMTAMLAGDALRSIVMEYSAAHYPDAAAFVGEIYRSGWSVSLIDPEHGPAPISRDTLTMLDPTRAHDLLLTR